MKKHFDKNLIISEEEEQFQSSSIYWIFQKLIDDEYEKVRDHCHITGKKVPLIFHNLIGYDSHLNFCEFKNFDVKIDVIPNRLEKCMAFFLNKNLVFIDSVQFMNSSLKKLVKNLSDNDFKYLIEELGSKNLELLKQKETYPYEYMDSFKKFNEEKLHDIKCFSILVKDGTTGVIMAKNEIVT